MTKEAQTTSAAVNRSAPALQRKCACGQHTLGGAQCDECRKTELALGPADDHFEREADRVAESVLAVAPGSRLTVTPDGDQLRRASLPGAEAAGLDRETEREIERHRRAGGTAPTNPPGTPAQTPGTNPANPNAPQTQSAEGGEE